MADRYAYSYDIPMRPYQKLVSSRLWQLTIIAGLAGMACLLWREYSSSPTIRMHAHILDVGQGDSILLVSPRGAQVLIDGGPDMGTLEEIGRLMPFFDRTIEILVLTHPNTDHLMAFPELFRRYRIGRILLSGARYNLPPYDAILTEVLRQKIPVIIADPEEDIALDDGLILDVLWPPREWFGAPLREVNDASVVLLARYGTGSILLTGDMEARSERAILASGADVKTMILKVAHHGSRTSSSTGFLLAAQPRVAAISLGKGNRYGHPHPSITERFRGFRIPVQRTDLEGTISFIW